MIEKLIAFSAKNAFIVVLLIVAIVGIIFGMGRSAVSSSIRESAAKYRVADWLEELARRGHKLAELKEGYMDFGSAQMIWKLEGGYLAASDPRRDGQAAGF